MNNSVSLKFLVRFAMVVFWLVCILLFLYAPLMRFFERKREITVLTWTDMIDSEILKRFENETGIRVRLSYFENNEELFIKLLAGRAQGFDVIIPSDYIMQKLIDHKLIGRIDRSKLLFWDRLNPSLLGVYFDPNNEYSIPYHWAVYGLGVHADVLKKNEKASWGILFDKDHSAKIAMLNSGREAFAVAAFYLFGAVEKLNSDQEKQVYELLAQQRPYVQAYVDADMRADYLLRSQQCDRAIIASPFIAKTLIDNPSITFEIPKEGAFIVLDSLVISSNTSHENEIYTFINFLFQPEILQHHLQKYPFVPATREIREWLTEQGVPASLVQAYSLPIDTLHFFKLLLSESRLNHLWMMVKV